MSNIVRHLKNHILLYILLVLFLGIFFYKLDYTSLTSWDEAWYAAISRNMAESGSFIPSMWNGKPFFDHPPLGFWITAISYKLFGINEFATRLPPAIMGVLAILLMYKIGETLFKNKYIGFVSALILGTSVWYVIRVRSGNLESIFVFFYILTMYLAIRSAKDFRWLPVVGLSLGGLIMSKTLVGTSAIPLVFLLNFHHIFNLRKTILYIVGAVLGFYLVVYPWYHAMLTGYSDFYQRHFIDIGTRGKSFESYFKINAEQPLFFLHMGVRKWYYLWLIASSYLVVKMLVNFGKIVYSFVTAKQKSLKKKSYDTYLALLDWIKLDVFLIAWNFVILYPFLTSEKTELWHLIPVYVPLALIIAYGLYNAGHTAMDIVKRTPLRKIPYFEVISKPAIANLLLLIPFIVFAAIQFKGFYAEVFPVHRYTPDDVAIMQATQKYKNEEVFLDDDYVPIAVFYSGKVVRQMAYEPEDHNTLAELLQSDQKDFIVVSRNWAVENVQKEGIPFKLLEKNGSFSILTKAEQ